MRCLLDGEAYAWAARRQRLQRALRVGVPPPLFLFSDKIQFINTLFEVAA